VNAVVFEPTHFWPITAVVIVLAIVWGIIPDNTLRFAITIFFLLVMYQMGVNSQSRSTSVYPPSIHR